MENTPGLDELIAFHGHLCPGLALGYRATQAGLKRLNVERARDEELIAIVENDSCSVDAVQFLAGATFGKGNLFFRDFGKQVFTFARRDRQPAVRVALKRGVMEGGGETGADAETSRQEKIDHILSAPVGELFDIRETAIDLPSEARIRRSVNCDRCGEPVMETRTVSKEGMTLCQECANTIG